MKAYLVALGAGTLVEIIYDLLNVRSPAPPVVALVPAWEITAESIFPNAPNTRARIKLFR
jgi:xanthosine utilization system XapX-like protein